METDFVGGGFVGRGFIGGGVAGGEVVGDPFGDVVQPHVVAEVEEDAREGDGGADGEAEVEGAQLFPDVLLVEVDLGRSIRRN